MHYPGADERAAFLRASSLPETPPHAVNEFAGFYERRRELLVSRLKLKLQKHVDVSQSVLPAGLTQDLDAELGEGDLDD